MVFISSRKISSSQSLNGIHSAKWFCIWFLYCDIRINPLFQNLPDFTKEDIIGSPYAVTQVGSTRSTSFIRVLWYKPAPNLTVHPQPCTRITKRTHRIEVCCPLKWPGLMISSRAWWIVWSWQHHHPLERHITDSILLKLQHFFQHDPCRQRLNKRGMRLMLDFVPNHSATDASTVESDEDFYVKVGGGGGIRILI